MLYFYLSIALTNCLHEIIKAYKILTQAKKRHKIDLQELTGTKNSIKLDLRNKQEYSVSDLMKIAERQQPAKRRSKLEPYLDELRRLQNAGYSLEQLKNFLAEINVNVSRQTIYDFLKRRESVVKTTSTHSDKKTEITKKEAGDETKEVPLASVEVSEKTIKNSERGGKNIDVKKPAVTKTPTQEELKNIARSTNVDDFFSKN